MDMRMRGPGRPDALRSMHGGKQAETTGLDVPIEIHGFIYIYNPPDLDLLGTGTAAEEAAAPGGAAPAEPPATTPDAPAATPPAETPRGESASTRQPPSADT